MKKILLILCIIGLPVWAETTNIYDHQILLLEQSEELVMEITVYMTILEIIKVV